jgi:hypothetical protein
LNTDEHSYKAEDGRSRIEDGTDSFGLSSILHPRLSGGVHLCSSVIERMIYLNRVGRVTPCAPPWRTRKRRLASDGAHGVTRPTFPLFICVHLCSSVVVCSIYKTRASWPTWVERATRPSRSATRPPSAVLRTGRPERKGASKPSSHGLRRDAFRHSVRRVAGRYRPVACATRCSSVVELNRRGLAAEVR